MADSEVRFTFGPLERRGMVAGLRGGQVGSIAGGLALAVVALRSLAGAGGAALAGVVALSGVGVAFLTFGGRTLEDWVPVLAGWLWVSARRRRRWCSAAPRSGVLDPSPPPVLAGCRVLDQAAPGAPAVIEDPRSGTLTAVLALSGGGFTLVDPSEKQRRVSAWASVLAGMAREGSVVHRVQWIERTRPGSASLEVPSDPAAGDAPQEALRSYAALVAAAEPSTPRHEILLAITLCPRRSRRAIQSAGGGRRGAMAVLGREVAVLESNLRSAEVQVDGVLGPAALSAALSAGYRPGACLRGTPWPLASESTWAAVRCDEWWHTVLWVAEWPRSEVGPDFLSPLLVLTPAVRAVSMVLEPISPSRAVREVEAARTAGAADDELRRRGGFMSTARVRRLRDGTARREAELADGHGDYRFSGYVSVSALTLERLEMACAEVEQLAGQSRLQLRRLYGQQDQALTFTLPLGRGLA